MVNKSADLTAERIESLKAALLAALSFTSAYGIAAIGNSLLLSEQFAALAVLPVTTFVNWLVRIAIVFIGLSVWRDLPLYHPRR